VRVDREPYRGESPRRDVAAVLDALLPEARAARRIPYVNGGEDSAYRALDAVL
jgi:hypothetical protein